MLGNADLMASSIGDNLAGFKPSKEFPPAPCCGLLVVVPAISGLVAVPVTTWESPVVAARVQVSLGNTIHECVWFYWASGFFSVILLYSISVTLLMFFIPSVFTTGFYEGIYWVRWTCFIKHKTELQFVLNHLSIQKKSWLFFSNNFLTSPPPPVETTFLDVVIHGHFITLLFF